MCNARLNFRPNWLPGGQVRNAETIRGPLSNNEVPRMTIQCFPSSLFGVKNRAERKKKKRKVHSPLLPGLILGLYTMYISCFSCHFYIYNLGLYIQGSEQGGGA